MYTVHVSWKVGNDTKVRRKRPIAFKYDRYFEALEKYRDQIKGISDHISSIGSASTLSIEMKDGDKLIKQFTAQSINF